MKNFYSHLAEKLHIFHSLKFRLFLLILAIGIIPTMILRFTILENYEQRAVSVRTADVQAQFKVLANHLISYNYLNDTTSEVVNAELSQLSDLYDGRVIIIDQNCNVIRDTYGVSEGKTMISEEIMLCMKGQSSTNYDRENQYIEVTTPIMDSFFGVQDMDNFEVIYTEDSVPNVVRGSMLISVSTDNIRTNVDILKNQASILQVLCAILLVGIAWLFSTLMVKPFDKVTQAISEVKDGFQTEVISDGDYVETEHIISAFNELLGRMKTLDESRQEFVSNVSHELKTPLTSMKVLADSLNMQEDVPVELYKEFMTDIAQEIDRENTIINDLLSLVKMDKTASDMNIENRNLNEIIEMILRRLRPIAKQRNIDVLMESVREVQAEVDEVKLTLAISNLVENAIKYNHDYGYVKVTLDADHQFATIRVEDNGIGIPKEAHEHIFERFYRVDKSHSREIGGTGLGLSITRNAILMHRGSIKIESEEGEGTVFIVKIPIIYQTRE